MRRETLRASFQYKICSTYKTGHSNMLYLDITYCYLFVKVLVEQYEKNADRTVPPQQISAKICFCKGREVPLEAD